MERRKGIVEQADAVATELKVLNLTLCRLREAGATQHVEFMLGEQRSYDSPPPDG